MANTIKYNFFRYITSGLGLLQHLHVACSHMLPMCQTNCRPLQSATPPDNEFFFLFDSLGFVSAMSFVLTAKRKLCLRSSIEIFLPDAAATPTQRYHAQTPAVIRASCGFPILLQLLLSAVVV